jgi:hypothetical protein
MHWRKSVVGAGFIDGVEAGAVVVATALLLVCVLLLGCVLTALLLDCILLLDRVLLDSVLVLEVPSFSLWIEKYSDLPPGIVPSSTRII